MWTVVIAGLGLFVDMYDLFIYNVVRTPSLTAMGLTGDALTQTGIYIQWAQVTGLAVGSLVWGPLGDTTGRKNALFGSILLYSLASLASACVHDPVSYGATRFLAGCGLAGEVGLGVTLVNEVLSVTRRAYGTMAFGLFGMAGIMAAALTARWMDWRWGYALGGGAGLMLLGLRYALRESPMFLAALNHAHISRGSLRYLIGHAPSRCSLIGCILIGLPVIFTTGVILTLAPEISRLWGVANPMTSGDAMVWGMMGAMVGDIGAIAISERFRSRKKAIALFLLAYVAIAGWFLGHRPLTDLSFTLFCVLSGCVSGYYVTQILITAESFGTHLRATAATLAPNAVRIALVPIYALFLAIKPLGMVEALGALYGLTAVAGVIGVALLHETFGRDMAETILPRPMPQDAEFDQPTKRAP